MRRILLLSSLLVALPACNCGGDKASPEKLPEAVAERLQQSLGLFPAEGTGVVLSVHDLDGLFSQLGFHFDRFASIVTTPEKLHKSIVADLGFDPTAKGGLAEAGIDPSGGVTLWVGGSGGVSNIKGFTLLKVGDEAKFLAAAGRLGMSLGSMELSEPVALHGGTWRAFTRKMGQRTLDEGGLFLKGGDAILTSGDKASLDILYANTGAKLDTLASLKKLQPKVTPNGQGFVFISAEIQQMLNAIQPASGGLEPGDSLIRFAIEKKKAWAHSAGTIPATTAKVIEDMFPKAVATPDLPANALIATRVSVSMAAILDVMRSVPQFAGGWKQVSSVLGAQGVDLEKDVIKNMGTTISGFVGIDGTPANPLMLMMSVSAGLDLAGGSPAQLKASIDKILALEGMSSPLKVVEGGYDVMTPAGPVKIRIDEGKKLLSVRFGKPGSGKLNGRPGMESLDLTGSSVGGVFVDLAGFAKVADGFVKGSSGNIANIAGKVAAALVLMDTLDASGTAGKEFQTNQFTLRFK
jgi:hypothetical protein